MLDVVGTAGCRWGAAGCWWVIRVQVLVLLWMEVCMCIHACKHLHVFVCAPAGLRTCAFVRVCVPVRVYTHGIHPSSPGPCHATNIPPP